MALFAVALLTTHGGHGAHLLDREQARLVIDQAPYNAVDAIHTPSLIMAVGPIAAIILALWLIKPADARRRSGRRPRAKTVAASPAESPA